MGAAPNFCMSDRTVGSKLFGVNEALSVRLRLQYFSGYTSRIFSVVLEYSNVHAWSDISISYQQTNLHHPGPRGPHLHKNGSGYCGVVREVSMVACGHDYTAERCSGFRLLRLFIAIHRGTNPGEKHDIGGLDHSGWRLTTVRDRWSPPSN